MAHTFQHTAKDGGRSFPAVIVNGVIYEVLETTEDREGELLAIRRPRGVKTYAARLLPDSPLYGSSRAWIVPGMTLGR